VKFLFKTLLAIALITFSSFTFSQSKDNILSNIKQITSSESCYIGLFSEYQTFVNYLEDKKGPFNREKYEQNNPKQVFDNDKQNINCQLFTYTVDGFEIDGFYIAPKTTEKLPVIILNRGGSGSFGNMTFPSLKHNAFYLVKQGFVVIGSQYRGGMYKPEKIGGKDEFGGSDVKDVEALFPIIDQINSIDNQRIGMLGGSRGSINMFRVAKNTKRLKAFVSIAGVYDLEHEDKQFQHAEFIYKRHIPNYETNKQQELEKRSVTKWADQLDLNAPILILHGAYDTRASSSGALKFASILQDLEHRFSITIYEGDDHFLSNYWKQAQTRTIEWFKKYL
jgi:dipeptidyl aminopeptidase/acylaminoacyl peptidase